MPIEPRSVMQSFFYNIIIPSIYFHPQRWPQRRRHQSESSSPPQSLQILRWFSSNKIFSSFLSKFKEPLQQSNLVTRLWSGLVWLVSPFHSSSSNATVSFVCEDPVYVVYILIKESICIEIYYTSAEAAKNFLRHAGLLHLYLCVGDFW